MLVAKIITPQAFKKMDLLKAIFVLFVIFKTFFKIGAHRVCSIRRNE
jgi:hypothetical protein